MIKGNAARVQILAMLRRALYKPRVTSVDGLKLYLDKANSLDMHLLRRGFESDLKLVRRIVQILDTRSKAFLDVGANSGFWSIYLQDCFSKTLAFEPDPEVVTKLIDNLDLNPSGSIEVQRVAVSNRNGMSNFASRKALDNSGALNDGMGSLVRIDGFTTRQFEVVTQTLDHVTSRLDLPVGLIKVDVEGAENMVLDGAAKTLEQSPIVVSEVLFTPGSDQDRLVEERLQLFPGGYIHAAPSTSGVLIELSRVMPVSDFNLFSIPDDSAGILRNFGLLQGVATSS